MPNPLFMHPCHTRPSHLTAPVSRLRKALSLAALTLASCLPHSIAAQTPAAKSIPSVRHPSLARPKSSPSAP
jgi:hypothetical protein